VSDAEKVQMLMSALEEIREATFKKYQTPHPLANMPTPMSEKLEAWARIQSIAARALREAK
jgi:hypothetical protein